MRQLHFLILSSTTSSMSFSVFVRPLPLISHHHKLHHLHTSFFSSSSSFTSTPAARSFPLLSVFRTPAQFFNFPVISHHHKLHHLHTAFFSSSSFFTSTPAARSFPLLPVFRTPALFFNFFLFSIRLTFNSSTSGSAACASLPASQFENYQSPTLWAPFVARGN